jgi:two-component system OmpR family response regulator
VRILVVEDNPAVARSVAAILERRTFAVELAADGDAGLERLLSGTYDVAIVDVMLPGRDGFSLVRAARAEGIGTPVLMLTARDAVEDRVHGLNSGADDYLVKPFAEEELLARVTALARRAERPFAQTIRAGALEIDVAARTARYAGRELRLGKTEFRLLEFLARNAGTAFTRAQLLERVWEYDFDGSSNVVDVYVSQLRRKLRAAGARAPIATVWGVGYKLEREP